MRVEGRRERRTRALGPNTPSAATFAALAARPTFLQCSRRRFGGILLAEKNRSEKGEHGTRRDRGRRMGRGTHYNSMCSESALVLLPLNAGKVNAAALAFPGHVCA